MPSRGERYAAREAARGAAHGDTRRASSPAPASALPGLLLGLGALLLGAALALRVFGGGAAAALSEPSLNVARAGLVTAALVVVALAGALGAARGRVPRLTTLGLLLWGAGLLVATPRSVDPLKALGRGIEALEDGALVCALVLVAGASARTRRALLALVVACGAAAGGLALKERAIDRPEARAEYRRNPQIAEVSEDLRKDLESRLFADETSGPFVIPNGLGAFGAVTALAGAGAALAAASAGGPLRAVAPAIGLGLAALAIALAGQKGALVGLTVGALAMLGALARGRRRWLARTLAGLAVACVLAVQALVLFVPVERLEALPGGLSFAVRHEYAQASLAMARESPLVGVGPGQYQVHYGRTKPPGAEETRHAHHDALEALAETGPLGLLGLGLVWLGLLWAPGNAFALRRDDRVQAAATQPATPTAEAPASAPLDPMAAGAPPGEDTARTRSPSEEPIGGAGASAAAIPLEHDGVRTDVGGVLLAGAALGAMALPLLGMPYRDPTTSLVLAVAVPALAYAIARALHGASGTLCAAGAFGGACGFVAQSGLDFLHREPGVLGAAVALAAVAATASASARSTSKSHPRSAALSPSATPAPAARLRAGLLALLAAAGLYGVAVVWLPPLAEADQARLLAERALREDDFVTAIEALQRAHRLTRSDPGPLVTLGDLAADTWRSSGDERIRNEALTLYRRAVSQRPDLAWAKRRVADLHLEAGEVRDALPWLEAACAADRGNPSHHLALARALALVGDFDGARTEARAALRDTENARTLRTRLAPPARAEAEHLAADDP